MRHRICLWAAIVAVACNFTVARAAEPMPQHPFMLWTKQDLAAIKQRIAVEPWAKQAYEKLLASNDKQEESLRNLLIYALDKNETLGDIERKKLFKFVDAPHPLGAANELTVLRYDILYDTLAPAQRESVEKKFREYLEYSVTHNGVLDKERFPDLFNDSKQPPYSRYDTNPRLRHNWLPNIIFPRQISANLMAVALRDPALARQVWERPGISLKWYFDESLADTGLYSEEFSKIYATPGALLLYCIAAKHAGLNELGFGYTGKNGATMQGHLYSLVHLAYPKVDLGSERPQIPTLTAGDLRGAYPGFPAYAFQQNLVTGYLTEPKALVVEVNAAKLRALAIAEGDVLKAIRTVAGDQVESLALVPGGKFASPDDLGNLVVSTKNGNIVRLRDIAQIRAGATTGGNRRWMQAGAWGGETRGKSDQWDNEKTPKMSTLYWYEIAQAQWPTSPFGYYLYHMRPPGEAAFIPSLYFGAAPSDQAQAEKLKPPAPSALHPQRGVAMLRAEESPAYWDAPAPAVGVRVSAPYAHAVNDAFTIAGFVAFNRPFYINRHTNPSYATGWTRSIESHAGIVVGYTPAERVEEEKLVAGSTDTSPHKPHARHREPQADPAAVTATHFSPLAKYVGMRSDGTTTGTVYKGVDFSRQFVLTREYLLDVARVKSPDARTCYWLAHGIGHYQGAELPAQPLPADLTDFVGYRAAAASTQELTVTIDQSHPRAGVTPRMPQSWYDKALSMSLRMLPDATPTVLGVADTPLAQNASGPDEFGGTSVIIARQVPANTASYFVAIHQPREKTTTPLGQTRLLTRSDTALAVGIAFATKPATQQPAPDDRIFLTLPTAEGAAQTLTAGDVTVTFRNIAMVRVCGTRVEAAGDISRLTLPARAGTTLIINGQDTPTTPRADTLEWSASKNP
jgi:hypothetical protein